MSEHVFLLVLVVILTAVIVLLIVFLAMVLWEVMKILRELYGITRNVREGSDALASDLGNVRKKFLKGISSAAQRFSGKGRARGKASSKDEDVGE